MVMDSSVILFGEAVERLERMAARLALRCSKLVVLRELVHLRVDDLHRKLPLQRVIGTNSVDYALFFSENNSPENCK